MLELACVLIAVSVLVYLLVEEQILFTPTVRKAFDAIKHQAMEISSVPAAGWKDTPGHICLVNNHSSILYWKTIKDGHQVETMDIRVKRVARGTLTITFRDREVVLWSICGSHQRPMTTQDNYLANQILTSVQSTLAAVKE